MNPYLDTHQDHCILKESASKQQHGPIVLFYMDLKNSTLSIEASSDWPNVRIMSNDKELGPVRIAEPGPGSRYESIQMSKRTEGVFVYYGFNVSASTVYGIFPLVF